MPPYTFECGCGTVSNSPDHNIPVGWSTARGLAWCGDCTAAGVPARDARHARPGRKTRSAA